jgi:hypothetical protein
VLPLELRAYEVLGITGLQTSFKELHLFQDDHRPI